MRMRCKCTNVSCEWVFCLHLPSVVGSLSSSQPKLVLSEKNFTSAQTVKNARSSNFLSSSCCVPNLWTRTMATKATGFPALVYGTSSLFEVDRTVVFFNSFELFFFSLSYLLASKNGSTFLLGPGHIFVV